MLPAAQRRNVSEVLPGFEPSPVDGGGGAASPTAPTTSDDHPCPVARQLPIETDSDLARVVTAWPDLPPHVRLAILALIGTAS
jgi:hypothetical protein